MSGDGEKKQADGSQLIERSTLCLPEFSTESVLHNGDPGFTDVLGQYFQSPESNATERMIALKNTLRNASTHDFWAILMKDMCKIVDAQCGFVAKRILVDDEHTAVEMPPLGEPGSCLMGVAFHINNDKDVIDQLYRDYKYQAYGAPCAHMKHEKVFIIPERMTEFIPNNPNPLPWNQSDSFIGLPLFSEGKCFAHFGLIWSSEGAARRKLSWNYLEMFLHCFEDIITQRILEGQSFAKESAQQSAASSRIIPLDAITASQSLKPYARSLSHELRTPMQGVVGLLDIMHTTVLEAIQSERSQSVKHVFQELKGNIELVQDSSKRAVEAADNVVHAYDLNMQMPDTPLTTDDERSPRVDQMADPIQQTQRPGIVIEGSGIAITATDKKRNIDKVDFHPGPPMKRLAVDTKGGLRQSYPEANPTPQTDTLHEGLHSRDFAYIERPQGATSALEIEAASSEVASVIFNPGYRHLNTKDFMTGLVNEAIRSYHPISRITTHVDLGEVVSVQFEGPRGEVDDLTIRLQIASDVPKTIVTEEVPLHFSLQKVIDNAFKFTTGGTITVDVRLARSAQIIEIRIMDTGCGITEESKAHLFKPHFQEDASISRSRDGLGLSLFNAKAHVRKSLGGDMVLERSATEGPKRGSEFLIRLPLSGPPDVNRPNTPLVGTPVVPRPSRPGSPRTVGRQLKAPSVTESIGRHRSPAPQISPVLRTRKLNKKSQDFNRALAIEVPLTIMVVEDNPINRSILVGYLVKLGYRKDTIIVAFDGVEAVAKYKEALAQGKHVDAILMDLWMPNMDGYEATDRIFKIADESEANPVIMAVTADITSESLERAKDCGMRGFLSKPYKVLDVQHLLVEHFGKDYLDLA